MQSWKQSYAGQVNYNGSFSRTVIVSTSLCKPRPRECIIPTTILLGLCALKKVCTVHNYAQDQYMLSLLLHDCLCTGCGRCWAIDGNWKLIFPHCMFPVSNSIPGMPRVNFPNVCTKQPLGRSAFCREHHTIALSKNFPTEIRKVLQQYEKTGMFSYLNLHN